MGVSREQVFTALFGLTQSIQWDAGTEETPKLEQFVTKTRRIALFSDVPAKQQPWIGQAEHNENSKQVTNLPYKRMWKVSWMVYHREGDKPNSVPAITNNLIIDAIERALEPKVTDPGYFDERNTLSGLVHHCFISGDIFKDPGDIDNQALIVVPITILVP